MSRHISAMRTLCGLVGAIAFAVLPFAAPSARAQDSGAVYIFMETVVCSQIPLAACDVLNADNAINLFWAARAQILQRYCGSMNENAARQLLDIGEALQPDECRRALAFRR